MDIVLNTSFTNLALPVVPVPDILVFSDDFARADALFLGVTPIGGKTWQLEGINAAGRIASGAAYVTSGNTAKATATIDTGYADGRFKVKLAAGVGSAPQNMLALVFRYVNLDNYLFLVVLGDNTWALYKRTAGVGAMLLGTTVVAANGDQVEVLMEGPSIILTINGVTVPTVTTVGAPFLTGTKVGFYNASPDVSGRWDDLSFGLPQG